jgi:hypothetical protein
LGHERVSRSEDDGATQVSGETAGRILRLPSFQRGNARRSPRPLKTIQERIGHALTGSFTLDVYGGQPEWGRNLEAAQHLGAELVRAIYKAVAKLETETNAGVVGSLLAIQEKGSGALSPKPLNISEFFGCGGLQCTQFAGAYFHRGSGAECGISHEMPSLFLVGKDHILVAFRCF